MEELQRQKAEVEARLNAAAPESLDVNPNIAEVYGREVQGLTDALAYSQTRQEAAAALRSLIGDVVLMPGGERGEVNATLRGELMGILDRTNVREHAKNACYNKRGCEPTQPPILVLAHASSKPKANASKAGRLEG